MRVTFGRAQQLIARRPFYVAAALALLGSTLFFIVSTLRWPLTGDAALMHYVAFLLKHGEAPYREILDINLPGSYVPNWLIQSAFGTSALAWRLYDFALLLSIGVSLYAIASPYSRFAGWWCGCLFALVHGRDGLDQAGQRDLLAAALILAGFALLVRFRQDNTAWPALLFGIAAGAALTVKPTTVLFIALLVVDCAMGEGPARQSLKRLLLAIIGWTAPLIACLLWLLHHQSLRAFVYDLRILDRYHAALGHVGWAFLLRNSVSPLLPIVIAAFLSWLLQSRWNSRPAVEATRAPNLNAWLLFAALAGWLSYLAQRRAYPYQRYPFLVFVLLLLALELTASFKAGGLRRWIAGAALLWTSLFLAPSSAWKAAHYQGATGVSELQLDRDLLALAASHHLLSLDHQVQCLDTVSGCISALEHLQVVQATGHLYDEFLFHPPTDAAVRDTRQAFASAMQSSPPAMFVLTDPLFPSGPDHYAKLAQWPEFQSWLDTHYAVAVTRTPTASVQAMGRRVAPAGYRIYVRRSTDQPCR